MSKWQQLSRKTQWLVVAILAGLVCGGLFGGYHVYVVQQVSARETLDHKLKAVNNTGSLTAAVLSFQDPNGYLTEGIDQEDLKMMQEKLNDLKDAVNTYETQYPNDEIKEVADIDELQRMLQVVEAKLTAQEQVNSLFTAEETFAIKGSAINQELALANGVGEEAVNQIVLSKETLPEDKWLASMGLLIQAAKEQLKQITEAVKAVDACYRDGKVDSNVTKKSYDTANEAVKKVKRTTDKGRLVDKLTEIKKVVDANEKKAKEEKEKAEADKVVQAAAEAESSSGEASYNTQNTDTTGADNGNVVANNGGSASVNGGGASSGASNGENGSFGGDSAGSIGGSDNVGGGSNSSGGNNSGGGTTTPPVKPQPEKPYAINPYGGSGTYYSSEAAAVAAGEQHGTNGGSGYGIYTEYWSDGTEKYYLELY